MARDEPTVRAHLAALPAGPARSAAARQRRARAASARACVHRSPRRGAGSAVARGLALAALLTAAAPSHAQAPPWPDRCAARLEAARAELARLAPWAGRGTVEVTPLSAPMTGALVTYETADGRLSALIEDYPGATPGPWHDAGLGECPDEDARPPALHTARNYAGRQAQITLTRARPRLRRAIAAVLEAALDACATY